MRNLIAFSRIDNQHESGSLSWHWLLCNTGNLPEVFRLFSGLVTSFVLKLYLSESGKSAERTSNQILRHMRHTHKLYKTIPLYQSARA